MMNEVWMVRAGEDGYLIDDFARGYIGIGWGDIGDLNSLNTQESIRSLYLNTYANEKPGRVPGDVAVIFKFRSVLKISDKVITYNRAKRQYLVGTVTSDYIYKPGEIKDYPHIRRVEWDGHVSRDDLPASSRSSLGSTLPLFSVNEDVWTDIRSLLSGKQVIAQEERIEEEKEELGLLREDIKGRAHELIKDKILKLGDEELEGLSAAILRAMGYKTRISPKGPDRGVDVFASPDGLGLEEPRIKVEVKHRQKTPMSAQDIRSFLGGLRQGDKGLYVSTGGFTKDAKYEADRANIPITLLDLDDLANLIVTHYESFDLEGYTLIALNRIYWPID